jgi:hypothetical protein
MTMIHDIAAHAAADGRPAVIFYFSDFDPAGLQMPISISRRLQAHRDQEFPDLDIQVQQVALTVEQVRTHGKPSTSRLGRAAVRAAVARGRWRAMCRCHL